MDENDRKIVAELRRNARASLSDLSAAIGLSRVTIRARIDRLLQKGVILGFSVVLKEDTQKSPIRGLTMLGIEGRGTDRILKRLRGLPSVQAIHSTNGRWDLILEIGTQTVEELDQVLASIRRIEGVHTSETNLLLSTQMTTSK